ncbi:MAG: NAD(P)H-hydrate dehydratase [Ardenticatenaceae bacterium]|nr:NAD(P)H-hydrate dehydratase [Anaerolineales bacterium]MCB8938648.1 NAD(P)H-hydrate dehydratase [Ardenticatenaceae bacterium]MCB8973884.1 NAD(P)H-hydrate dehydratase [Ardenticatenaceae bacterium]
MKLFTVSQMIAAEKTADSHGNSYAQMMETAGRSLAEAVIARWPVQGASVLVLVGPGNNGGDGLVAGRYLAEAGADVAFYLFKPRDPATDENYVKIQQLGLFTIEAEFDQRFRVLRTRLRLTDILIDALLGTGVTRPITGDLAKLLQQTAVGLEERRAELVAAARSALTNLTDFSDKVTRWQGDKVTSQDHVTLSPGHLVTPSPLTVAVDCPSGLNCDTGALDPLALPADLTVTFAGPKRGHFIFPGATAVGELVVADIGITEEMVADVPIEVATLDLARSLLPTRPKDGHKGTFGKLLIAAGCEKYRGAPLLAARGAFRAGAGLVTLAVPNALRLGISIALPEATYAEIEEEVGWLTAVSAHHIRQIASRYTALLIGPGLGDADDFITTLLPTDGPPPNVPMVLDADALNCLSRLENWWERLPPRCILTPHPAEMARLMGISLAELLAMDRIETALAQAQKWNQVVLLKGAYTVVAAPNGRATLLPFANPVLAVGGSGDVLSGVIATLLAQGLPPYNAARLGGMLHALAGELCERDQGVLAAEIADFIPKAVQLSKQSTPT